MTLSKTHPNNYFSNVQLLESQLVRFLFEPSKAQLDIVVLYAAETLGDYFEYLQSGGKPENYKMQSADFRMFRFLSVEDVHTQLGTNVPKNKAPRGTTDELWSEHERKVLLSRHRLITDIKCKPNLIGFKCSMYLTSFGEHNWEFQQVHVDSCVANIKKRGDSYEYRDSETGIIIDPKDPFEGQMTKLDVV